jgi:hypothetical protein
MGQWVTAQSLNEILQTSGSRELGQRAISVNQFNLSDTGFTDYLFPNARCLLVGHSAIE